jgi:hypothetical protein
MKVEQNTLQIQFLWTWPLAMWGLSACEARYYGWRLWLRIGPAHVLIGRATP